MSERDRIESRTVQASPGGTAAFLRQLAADIESAAGEDVLIGLWNTGHGEPWEFTFQVVLTSDPVDRGTDAAAGSPDGETGT